MTRQEAFNRILSCHTEYLEVGVSEREFERALELLARDIDPERVVEAIETLCNGLWLLNKLEREAREAAGPFEAIQKRA